jgi:hypothetical protein
MVHGPCAWFGRDIAACGVTDNDFYVGDPLLEGDTISATWEGADCPECIAYAVDVLINTIRVGTP